MPFLFDIWDKDKTLSTTRTMQQRLESNTNSNLTGEWSLVLNGVSAFTILNSDGIFVKITSKILQSRVGNVTSCS